MKDLVQALLRKTTGYQLSKFDPSSYVYRETLAAFIESSNPQGKILEIGAARASYLKAHFRNVTTLDLEPPSDVLGDAMCLPFSDGSFDCVAALETLEHVKDPVQAMREIHRALKPNGTFIGSAPFTHEIHCEHFGDYWRFTRQCWDTILLRDFRDVQLTAYGGTPRSPGWYLARAVK
jgi:SAM-dependent methyltransferase